MKTYSQSGDVLTLTAPYAVASGGGFQVGSIVAVAQDAAANGAEVVGVTRGVFVGMPKQTGQAWTAGAKLYWDDTDKDFTTTATDNTLCAVAVAAAASGAAIGDVWLPGFVV